MPCAPFVFMFAAHNTTSTALASSKSLRAQQARRVRSAGIARLRTRIFYTAGAERWDREAPHSHFLHGGCRAPRSQGARPRAGGKSFASMLPAGFTLFLRAVPCPQGSTAPGPKNFFILGLNFFRGRCYTISVSSPRPALAGSCRGRKPKTKPQRREALKKEKTMNKSTMIAAIFAASAFSAFAADVYSSNIVGYNKLTLNPGNNLVSAQFVPVGG